MHHSGVENGAFPHIETHAIHCLAQDLVHIKAQKDANPLAHIRLDVGSANLWSKVAPHDCCITWQTNHLFFARVILEFSHSTLDLLRSRCVRKQ
jgi:hypothetical protein